MVLLLIAVHHGQEVRSAGNTKPLANMTCASPSTPCALPMTAEGAFVASGFPRSQNAADCSFVNASSILVANPQYGNILWLDADRDAVIAAISTANLTGMGVPCPPAGAAVLPIRTAAIVVCATRGEVWRVDLVSRVSVLVSTRCGSLPLELVRPLRRPSPSTGRGDAPFAREPGIPPYIRGLPPLLRAGA